MVFEAKIGDALIGVARRGVLRGLELGEGGTEGAREGAFDEGCDESTDEKELVEFDDKFCVEPCSDTFHIKEMDEGKVNDREDSEAKECKI